MIYCESLELSAMKVHVGQFFGFLFIPFFILSNSHAQTNVVDSLQQIIAQQKGDTIYAKALLHLGVILERSDLKRSTESYWAILKMPENQTFDKFKTNAAVRLAGNYSAMGVLDSVDYYFDQAELFLRSSPNDQKLAYTLYNGRGIHLNRIGKFEAALSAYDKAISLDHQVIGLDNVAGLYINLSNVYKQMDDQKSNFEVTYKALDIFEKTQIKTGLAFVYNSLGTAHYHIKNYDDAEKYFLKSMEYRKLLGDKRGESMVMGNLGNVYMDQAQHQKAKEYFELAMEMQESLGLKEMVGIQLYNIGRNYLLMDEPEPALAHFQKAQNVFKEAGISTYDSMSFR